MTGKKEQSNRELSNWEFNNNEYNNRINNTEINEEYCGCNDCNECNEGNSNTQMNNETSKNRDEDFKDRLDRIESEDNFTSMKCETCQYFLTYYYNGSGVCLLDHDERDIDYSCSRWSEGNKIKMAKATIHGLFDIDNR